MGRRWNQQGKQRGFTDPTTSTTRLVVTHNGNNRTMRIDGQGNVLIGSDTDTATSTVTINSSGITIAPGASAINKLNWSLTGDANTILQIYATRDAAVPANDSAQIERAQHDGLGSVNRIALLSARIETNMPIYPGNASVAQSTNYLAGDADGIGVNTTNPAYTLDVNGTLRVVGAATLSGGLAATTTISGSAAGSLTALNVTNTEGSLNNIVAIDFVLTNVASNSRIGAIAENVTAGNRRSGLVFYTVSQAGGGTLLRWQMTSDGHLLATTDNSWDIGASGATRPRNIYAGTLVTAPTVTGTTLTGTLSTAAQTNVTSLGTLAANLLFTDNTYDIGQSGATRPRHLYLSGNALVGSALGVGAAASAGYLIEASATSAAAGTEVVGAVNTTTTGTVMLSLSQGTGSQYAWLKRYNSTHATLANQLELFNFSNAQLRFGTNNTLRGYIGAAGELVWGTPGGVTTGTGIINAVSVYDDGVLLTDAIWDHYYDGQVRPEDAERWAGLRLYSIAETEAFTRAHRHLPSLPGRSEWQHDRRSTGQMITHLWETIERQQIQIYDLHRRIAQLET